MSEQIERLANVVANNGEVRDSELDAALIEADAEIKRSLAAPQADTGKRLAELFTTLKIAFRLRPSVLLAECFLQIAQYFYISSRAVNAIEPAGEAVRAAQLIGDPSLVRKALTFQGVMKCDTGNLGGAIECYSEALDLAVTLGDLRAETVVWNNLGLAFLYASQHGDAIACFDRVCYLAGGDVALKPVVEAALANTALACLHLEDFARGLRAAKAATDLAPDPQNAMQLLSRVTSESLFTRLLLETQALQTARERCEIAKQFAARSKLERAQLDAAMAEGLCEIHSGMVDVGLSRLQKVLDKARVMTTHLRDALVAIIKGHEVAGKHDIALVYLRELMMFTKKLQEESALLHHRLHLEQLDRKNDVPDHNRVLERRQFRLQGKLAEQVAPEVVLRARIEMLERLAVTAELRDDSTGEHSYRVGRLAALLAHEFGCDEQTCTMIDLAARLHDIGKIGIPDGILLKSDKLNQAEIKLMQTHANIGADLLAQSEVPHLQMAEEIARHHHEWWNGDGYPFGIGGTAIPTPARITALADVFDALTHKRPYKQAWPVDRALAEIASLKGKQFDPHLTDLFLDLVPRLQREVPDLDQYLGQAAQDSKFIRARQKIAATLAQFSKARKERDDLDPEGTPA